MTDPPPTPKDEERPSTHLQPCKPLLAGWIVGASSQPQRAMGTGMTTGAAMATNNNGAPKRHHHKHPPPTKTTTNDPAPSDKDYHYGGRTVLAHPNPPSPRKMWGGEFYFLLIDISAPSHLHKGV